MAKQPMNSLEKIACGISLGASAVTTYALGKFVYAVYEATQGNYSLINSNDAKETIYIFGASMGVALVSAVIGSISQINRTAENNQI